MRLARPDGKRDDGVADARTAAHRGAGIAAEVEIGPVDPLHRQERSRPRRALRRSDRDGFETAAAAPGRHTRASPASGRMTFSPSRAETGMKCTEAKPRLFVAAR